MRPCRITLSIADGNPLVLAALSELFQRDPRFSLVATTATAEAFLGGDPPDSGPVAVIDWHLPPLGARGLIETLRDAPGAPRLVVYGDDPRGDLARQAMLAGAAAVVARNTPVDRLIDCLPRRRRAVRWCSPFSTCATCRTTRCCC